MTKRSYWHGDVPTHCQLDEALEIEDYFVDGSTIYGPWTIMHQMSHLRYGRGLGVGRGQLYEKQPDGRWLKIGG